MLLYYITQVDGDKSTKNLIGFFDWILYTIFSFILSLSVYVSK